jgi:hypothetical protein
MSKKQVTWAGMQAASIKRYLDYAYGRGFERLSDEQRNALFAEQVIFLLRTQHEEKYAPAIELLESVLTELGHHSFYVHPIVQVDT